MPRCETGPMFRFMLGVMIVTSINSYLKAPISETIRSGIQKKSELSGWGKVHRGVVLGEWGSEFGGVAGGAPVMGSM